MITGGARSGKSRYALEKARRLGGGAVSFLATARTLDPEMEQRIRRHREEGAAARLTSAPARATRLAEQ